MRRMSQCIFWARRVDVEIEVGSIIQRRILETMSGCTLVEKRVLRNSGMVVRGLSERR